MPNFEITLVERLTYGLGREGTEARCGANSSTPAFSLTAALYRIQINRGGQRGIPMIAANNEPTGFRFSTGDLAKHERAGAVRGLYERGMLPVKLEPLPDCRVRVDVVQRSLPGLGVLSGVLCGVRQEGGPSASARDDDLFLGVNLAGSSRASQGGREVVLHDGDAVLLTRGQAGFVISRPTSVHFIGLRVPRSALTPLVTGLNGEVIRVVPHGTDALGLLAAYVGIAIKDSAVLASSDLQRLVTTHAYDLFSVVLGATRDALAMAEGRGVRAARLQAIRSDIAANLCDPTLTVTAVADRHRVTPRYVHKLFEAEGLTFSEFLLGLRLARAHRTLADPRLVSLAISSVAYQVGFGDLSHFNRAFRRIYGATPSEVRRTRR